MSLTLYTLVRDTPREKAAKNEGEVLVDSSESSVNDVFAEGVFFIFLFLSPGPHVSKISCLPREGQKRQSAVVFIKCQSRYLIV